MTPLSIGVVGGGQLAMMMVEASQILPLDLRVLARPSDESAESIDADVDVVESFDADVLTRFARTVDVVTFDHERPPNEVAVLEESGAIAYPGSAAMRFADKAQQRMALQSRGIAVPEFRIVDRGDEAGSPQGRPLVVKRATGGYDGRGLWVVDDDDELRAALDTAPGDRFVVEELLDLDAEVAVCVVTGVDGSVVSYPPVDTIQRDGMCDEVRWPSELPTDLQRRCTEVATEVADVVGAVGMLAVELFVTRGRVLVNEVAPRPHNSAHLTIEAFETSQFENHLRAVAGLPLGRVGPVADAAAMVNIVGVAAPGSGRAVTIADHGAWAHWYGKSSRPGRKVGHITALGATPAAAVATARDALEVIERESTPVSATAETAGRS